MTNAVLNKAKEQVGLKQSRRPDDAVRTPLCEAVDADFRAYVRRLADYASTKPVPVAIAPVHVVTLPNK